MSEGEPHSPAWLTLGAASRLLGVSESTIRRWADSGEIRSFRTAGGHRRVAADDIRAIVEQSGQRAASGADRIGSLALARVRRRLARTRGTPLMAHLQSLDEESKERLRLLGRQLVDLFARCIASGARHERYAEDARAIGREYGRVLAQAGGGLGPAVAGLYPPRRLPRAGASPTPAGTPPPAEGEVAALAHLVARGRLGREGGADLYESLMPVQAGSARSRNP